jgi:PEP-CTERM motif
MAGSPSQPGVHPALPTSHDHPSRLKIISLAAVASLLAGATAANATVLYQTGFEAPVYSLGPLNGQDGWYNTSLGQVQTTTVLSGSQAMSIDLTAFDFPIHDVAYDSSGNPSAILRITDNIFLTGTLHTQVEGIAIFGDPDEDFLGQLDAYSSSFRLGLASSTVGIVPATPDVWHALELDINFATQTQTAYVDGKFLGQGPLASPTTTLDFVLIGGYGAPGRNETVSYDNFSFSTIVPEPSSMALLGVGLACLGLVRRRHA